MPNPSPSYARLCMGFAVAKLLQHGTLDPTHFRGEALSDPATFAIAGHVQTEADGSADPNALTPQSVSVELKDGTALVWRCAQMLANPSRPLTRKQHLAKFHGCGELAAVPLGPEPLIDMVEHLERLDDMRAMAALLGD